MARKTIAEGMKALATRQQAKQAEKPVEQFFRVKEVTRPDDHFPAFEVEMLVVQGQRILRRESVSKRDLKQMTLARLEEIHEDGGYRPDAG